MLLHTRVVDIQVVKNSMEPLVCTGDTAGHSVLVSDPSIVCDPSDSTFSWLHYYSKITLVVYGVGIPVMFVFVLVFNRKGIVVDQVRPELTDAAVCHTVVVYR